MKMIVPVLAGLLMVAGCQSAKGSMPITALPQALSSGGTVTGVTLANTPGGVGGGFRDAFQSGVMSSMQQCATGATPLTVRVTLDGYQAANPGLALFAPSQSQISGVATLYDAEGTEVGRYRIRRSFTMGGVGGMVAAAGAEKMMIDHFGDELCKQAFAD
ncbi:hypothetical protein [Brevundimonas sp.]|uniref:hypothetical protein n=1 Tax=Brevundimonas sp. TaxID=1871086 RepID=UPI003AF8E831